MNFDKIIVFKYQIYDILNSEADTIYEVPKYQREYTWGLTEWESLLDDLIENESGYFLGTIICINSETRGINSHKYEVVDGQQRLVSISLLLAALYSEYQENENLLNEEQNSDKLGVKHKLVVKNTQDVRVIPQTQGNNHDDYYSLLATIGIISPQPEPKFYGLRRIVKAYNYFKKNINKLLNKADDKIAKLTEILNKVNKAIMIDIIVQDESDAYTLFESLNNRGIPLSAVDLIKNTLLARLENMDSKNADYYFSKWTEIIDNLGNNYSDQERFFRQNYNAFRKEFNAPISKEDQRYPLGTIATRSTLLGIYEEIIKRDPVMAIEQISENSKIYGNIILNKTEGISDELKDVYFDLQCVQGAPSYLLIMYLSKNKTELDIDDADIVSICKLLVNFFVRRNLTDTPPTRDLNRMFMSIVESIEKNNYRGNDIYLMLRNTLIRVSASDEEFEKKLYGPVYDDNSSATRFILCMMAKNGMTRETYQNLWQKDKNNKYLWSIEHIFPQGSNIPPDWVDMIANGDEEKAEELQQQYVHTFGNLTMTAYNSNLSNESFLEKREHKDSNGNPIGYKNGLNLNSDVCDKEEWTIDIIKDRTNRMVKEIMEMFAM